MSLMASIMFSDYYGVASNSDAVAYHKTVAVLNISEIKFKYFTYYLYDGVSGISWS